MVLDALSHPQRSIIELSRSQVAAFAGNVLELSNMHNERIIAISETALNSLNESQLAVLSRSGLLLPVSIPVIEKVGGGSIRCMLAEVY
jgi:arginine N-succinyltransferase